MWAKYLSLLSIQIFYGMLTNYAAVKDMFAAEFSFSNSFLGSSILTQMVSMVTRSIGTILLILFPIPNPKTIYFLCTLIQFLAFLVFASAHYLPSYS